MANIVNVPNDVPMIFSGRPIKVTRKYETCQGSIFLAYTHKMDGSCPSWVVSNVLPNGEIHPRTTGHYLKAVKAFEEAIAELNRTIFAF